MAACWEGLGQSSRSGVLGWAERIQGGAAGAPSASGSVQGDDEFLPGQLWRARPDLAEVMVTQISMIIIVPRIHQALAVSQALV